MITRLWRILLAIVVLMSVAVGLASADINGCQVNCNGMTDDGNKDLCYHVTDPGCGGGGGECGDPNCPGGYVKTCYLSLPQTDRTIKNTCNCRTSTGTIWGQYTYYDWGIHEVCNDREICQEIYTWGNYTDCYGCACIPICTSTAPTAPSLSSPTNAARLSSTNVTLSWGAPSSWGSKCGGNSNQYRVYVGTTNPPTNLIATLGSGTTTTNFTGLRGNTYYWYVQTSNGALTANSAVRNFTILQGVVGTVYLDPNNTCSTSTPWNLGGIRVDLRGTAYSSAVEANGVFAVGGEAALGTYGIDLTGIPEGYVCSTACGSDCPGKSGVVNPSTGNNFFLTTKREAWWQAFGSSLYAGGDVKSEIPINSFNLIEPGLGGAIGALLRASGSVDTGTGEVSDPGYSTISQYKGKTMNYDFFAAQTGVTRNTENDWVSNLLTKPGYDENKEFYYIDPTSSEATVSEPWNVVSGESYIVFVDGNLRIASDITVEQGGFLAFIVNGDITVSPAVTQVQGLFVADESLVTESNSTADVQLAFQGSMVAWGGVALGRDLSASNIDDPAETFSYRPDFLVNMPEKMKVFALRWQEVAPGTFEN